MRFFFFKQSLSVVQAGLELSALLLPHPPNAGITAWATTLSLLFSSVSLKFSLYSSSAENQVTRDQDPKHVTNGYVPSYVHILRLTQCLPKTQVLPHYEGLGSFWSFFPFQFLKN